MSEMKTKPQDKRILRPKPIQTMLILDPRDHHHLHPQEVVTEYAADAAEEEVMVTARKEAMAREEATVTVKEEATARREAMESEAVMEKKVAMAMAAVKATDTVHQSEAAVTESEVLTCSSLLPSHKSL